MSRQQPGRNTGHQPGPSTPRRVLNLIDPTHLANDLGDLCLGPADNSGGSGGQSLAATRIEDFFVLDGFDLASNFLSNFPSGPAGKQRQRVFLTLFTMGEKNKRLYAGRELMDRIEQSINPAEVRTFLL
jgi:hypothetical protein